MAHVHIHDERIALQSPVLIEGLPGLGLVGKIATDHLIDQFGMTYYGSIECPGLPPVATYHGGSYATLPPVRVYADEERNLLALQSDVPVSPTAVSTFAGCISQLVVDHDALPLYLSGRPPQDEPGPPEPGETPDADGSVCGIATGTAGRVLEEHGIDPPREDGVWRGPTGALLNAARVRGLNALGLVVEARPNEPDPGAACRLLEDGIGPIAGVDVHAEDLRECADDVRRGRKGLAEAMHPGDDESSRAEPLRMYQ